MATHNKYQTEFGKALSEQLSATGTSANALANDIGVSRTYISKMMTGDRPVTARWADTVARALALSPTNTVELHKAAALDAGYKLDLTKK